MRVEYASVPVWVIVAVCYGGLVAVAGARVVRELAWSRVAGFVGVPVALIGLLALAADQTVGRGIVSWGLCSREAGS